MNGCKICGDNNTTDMMCNQCKYDTFISSVETICYRSSLIIKDARLITSNGVIYCVRNGFHSHAKLVSIFGDEYGYMMSGDYPFGVDETINYFIERFDLVYVSSNLLLKNISLRMRKPTTKIIEVINDMLKMGYRIEIEFFDNDNSYIIVESKLDLNKINELKFDEDVYDGMKCYRDRERLGDKFNFNEWIEYN